MYSPAFVIGGAVGFTQGAFVFGSANRWTTQKINDSEVQRRQIKSALKHGDHSTTYLLSEQDVSEHKETPFISMAALLAETHGTGLFAVQLPGSEVPSSWVCLVIDGQVEADSDYIIQLASESDRNRLEGYLQDAAQLIDGETQAHQFASPDDLIASLVAYQIESLISDISLTLPKKFNAESPLAKAALVGVFVLVMSAYAWYELVGFAPEPEEDNSAQLLEAYRSQLRRIEQLPSVDVAESFVKSALQPLPLSPYGFQLKSVSCRLAACSAVYGHVNARLISPVLEWAWGIDPNAVFDGQTKRLTLQFQPAQIGAALPLDVSSLKNFNLSLANYIAAINPSNATVSFQPPSRLMGSELAGRYDVSGTWNVSGVDAGWALAVVEGLQQLPGFRFDQFNFSDNKISLGGTYAFSVQ